MDASHTIPAAGRLAANSSCSVDKLPCPRAEKREDTVPTLNLDKLEDAPARPFLPAAPHSCFLFPPRHWWPSEPASGTSLWPVLQIISDRAKALQALRRDWVIKFWKGLAVSTGWVWGTSASPAALWDVALLNFLWCWRQAWFSTGENRKTAALLPCVPGRTPHAVIGGPGVARACLFHLSIYLFKSLWGLGWVFFVFLFFYLCKDFSRKGKCGCERYKKISLLGKYIKSPWAKVIWNESYPSGLKLYQRQNYFFLPSFSLMYVSYSCLKTVTQGRPCFQGERDRTGHLGQVWGRGDRGQVLPCGPSANPHPGNEALRGCGSWLVTLRGEKINYWRKNII